MIKSWPCKTYGSKEHAAVVFLHGFLGSGQDWDFLISDFEKDYYCIFPDLPGHGANLGTLPEKPLTFDWMARGLARTLQTLEVVKAHLIGYSLGGRLALYFTAQFPKRVQTLVLESASPGLAGRHERQERRMLDQQRAGIIRSDGLQAFLDSWYQMPIFASLQSKPELLTALKASRLKNNSPEIARVIAELSPGCQPVLWKKLPEVRNPVLLLAGDQDEKYLTMVLQMAESLPSSKIEIAPSSGHNIHLEDPGWYIRITNQFISNEPG